MPTTLPNPSPAPSARLAVLAGTLALCALVSACTPAAPPAENELFQEASLALEDESYATAISDYKKLLEEYPFSDKAEIASLNIAYAHFLKEEYAEAIAAFNDFERLYPVSPLLPFVSYNIGMCWLDQAKDGDRDATASEEALRQFRKVASEFPKTLYADLATFRQQQARENLSNHEIVVGNFYRERKHFDAAAARYRYAMKEYANTENAGRAAAKLRDLEAEIASGVKPAEPDSPVDDVKIVAVPVTEPATPAPDAPVVPSGEPLPAPVVTSAPDSSPKSNP